VILGFPGAIVLAALNWRRIGRTDKAIAHLAAAVIGTWALYVVHAGSVGLVVGIAVGYYLFQAQRTDQAPFVAAGRVRERNGLVGAVLALVASIVIAGSGALAAGAMGDGGLAHRGEVLFGMGAGSDACAPAGQATVFGPTDKIFFAAVMREKVQPGARVDFEIDSADVTAGPYPVPVQPPFDCLATASSIGPFDPGTYVIRYRYDAQPGIPDLATGTFTIRASLASSVPGPLAAPSTSP
jgi:hypothetical protein